MPKESLAGLGVMLVSEQCSAFGSVFMYGRVSHRLLQGLVGEEAIVKLQNCSFGPTFHIWA